MNLDNFAPLVTLTKIICEFLFVTVVFLMLSKAVSYSSLTKILKPKPSKASNLYEFSPFVVGPTIALMIFSFLHSLQVKSQNSVLILLVLSTLFCTPAIYNMLQKSKKFNLLTQIKSNSTKLVDFFGTLALTILFFIQTKSSILMDGYRTRGNNDPFDYLTLGRVFENSPEAFINLHQEYKYSDRWYEYSDRAGPWVTRLISLLQSILPGGRFGDFSTFVFLTYFTLFMVSFGLLKLYRIQRSFAFLLIYFIFTTSTMSYIFSQGFFLQAWGLIVILEFSRSFIAKKMKNSISDQSLSFGLLIIFVILTFFVYFPYVPLLIVLYVCLFYRELLQFRFNLLRNTYINWRKVFTAQSKVWQFSGGFFYLILGFYFVKVLLPPILIMSDFFKEMSSGNYGWPRSIDDYLGDGEMGTQVPPGLLFCLFVFLTVTSILPKRNRSSLNLGFFYFGIFNAIVYLYYVVTNGVSSYQTWKYFSFLFPLAFFFSVISSYAPRTSSKKQNNSRIRYNSRYILATLMLSFFVGKSTMEGLYPNPTLLTRQTINAVESLRNLENQNVGIAFNDTGTNMLLGGIIPSKSISMLGPSYYGVMDPLLIPKLDVVLTSMEFLISRDLCRSIKNVPVLNGVVLVDSTLENRNCIQSMLK